MATQTLTMGSPSRAVEIQLPSCDFGIGSVISKIDSPELIEGVRIHPLVLWPDDRGHFLELFRLQEGLVTSFSAPETQVSAAVSYPGTIKAFHYHLHQTDCWSAVTGMFQFVFADLRPGSRTYGARNTVYSGASRPWQVLIPPGVAHGYKVVGLDPGVLVYATDRHYNPSDEGRIPYNDVRLNYDWETQHK